MKKIFLFFVLFLCHGILIAQPPNINFEFGDLTNWTFYIGTAAPVSTPTLTAPLPWRHALMSGSGLDPYGNFPVVDPEFPSDPTFPSCGTNHYSLKLGNDSVGAQAERARYVVHIPTGATSYHLLYRYALVLQDLGSLHDSANAPKMIVSATDITSGTNVACAYVVYMCNGEFDSSFVPGPPGLPVTPVGYKTWATASIDLSGMAGHDVAIDFTTADCSVGGHFGYAYIDFVNLCPNSLHPCYPDTIASLKAPPGFFSYIWYLPGFASAVALEQVPSPPISSPSVTSTYAVVAIPVVGCWDTFYVTVDPIIPTITGTFSVCVGSTTTLSSTSGSGAWNSGSPGIASVNPATGVVTGLSAGTARITYTLAASGCMNSVVVTVNPLPNITGITDICIGSSSTLSGSPAGGTWSSSSGGVATVGSLSGIVASVSAGTTSITYRLSTGCQRSVTVTVDPLPSPITGDLSFCVGGLGFVTSTPAGGTWTTANPSIAVWGSGFMHGIGVGTTTLTYTLAACSVTTAVTVNPLPAPITGTASVCLGSTSTLGETSTGGGWLSANPSVASIDYVTGIVTGNAVGTADISYAFSSSPFCDRHITVTVNPLPNNIGGTKTVCAGSVTVLGETTSGGTWSSSNPAIAGTTTPSGSFDAIVGVSPGTATISYILSTGCYATAVVTVLLAPAAITGSLSICKGTNTTLADVPGGGTWSSSDASIATIGSTTGAVAGVNPGSVIISYTLADGCGVGAVMTIDSIPVISGTLTVCTGFSTALGAVPAGGTWTSGSTGIAAVGSSTGIVTGGSAGTSVITYVSPAGCTSRVTVTVYATPSPILGTLTTCVGSTTVLSDLTSGGTWTSGNTSIASVTSGTGKVTGVSGGTVIITYTVTGGCTATVVFTVNPLPSIIVLPSASLCVGDTMTAHDTATGGTWTTGSPLIIIGPATGFITATSTGTATITYTLPTGCRITRVVTVNPLPLPITGIDSVCVGQMMNLGDGTPGGTWTSSAPAIGSVDASSGVVTGIVGGTTVITYTLITGCHATTVVTVNPLPVVGLIVCPDTVCLGITDTLSDPTAGGSWGISDPSIAGIVLSPLGGPVTITGLAAGTAIVSYTVTNHCGPTTVTKIIRVTGPPVVAPITGILGVCSGFTDTLYDITSGGTWSSSDPSLATVGLSTGIVSGIASGSMTITYRVTNTCGTNFVTTNVLVNMEPYITANFVVACQTYIDSINHMGNVISGGTECIQVCDSSVVRYYANGVAGSAFTWNIAGGTIVATYPGNDSVDVLWPTTIGLIAQITLHDTFSHCIDSAHACIRIISKPKANFWTSSNHYCLGDNIVFHDLSTGDPAYYSWAFGDGTGSATAGTAEHSYSVKGTYTVTLTVKNGCNCKDSMSFVLVIDKNPGPDIECPSIVCDSEYATYHSNAPCAFFIWNVIGGTIISGAGTSSILVHWDNVDSTGFGYVSLSTPGCPICSDPTTIKVPVIMQSPKISGPHTICQGAEYIYSLPLWPATDYRWGVLDSSDAIVGCHDDHSVVVRFNTPGTYVIHGWYQNRIKLCGGNVFDTIVVVPATAIAGITKVCADPAVIESYSLAAGYSADWRLKDATGALAAPPIIGSTSFNFGFNTPGLYLLCATGAFCADSLTITVAPLPTVMDSLTGPDTICLNRTYTYKAWNDIPGAIYSWEAIGGTVSPASGTNVVSVVWTSTGPKQLKVRHVSVTAPYCEGQPAIMNIIQESVSLSLTGNTTPCANSYKKYYSNYTRGETYDWLILPNTVGSVVNGNHSDSVQVLWNNATTITTANIVVKVSKCDSVFTDTLAITVQPTLGVTITEATDTVCPGSPVLFTASAGGISYSWSFGDGMTATTTTDTISHAFPPNPTTANIGYTVKVTIIPDPFAFCPITGTADTIETVLPGPVAYLSSGTYVICTGDTVLLDGTVTSNVSGVTYTWVTLSGGSGFSTGATYHALTTGLYYFIATAGNGCSANSNIIFINSSTTCGESVPYCTPSVSTSHSCTSITVTAGSAGTWSALVPPLVPFTGGLTETATYDVPGIYWFTFTGASGCDTITKDTIMLVPDFRYTLRCGTAGFDSIKLMDHTAYLPFVSITGINWLNGGVPAGSGANLTLNLPGPATYTITETVNATGPDGAFTCSKIHIITLPGQPMAAFTDSVAPICENVPVQFTSLSTGAIVAYNWDFNDSSGVLLPNPQRTFTWPITSTSNPHIFSVKLTVTDSIGCTDDTTRDVSIYENTLGGIMEPNATICTGSLPYPVNYIALASSFGPYTYVWSTGGTTLIPSLSVSASGAYWATVLDAHRCQFTPVGAENVKVLHVPPAIIFGVQHYCIGDVVRLYGYNGGGVTYQWFRNDTLISTDSALADPGRPVGHYGYKLVITVTDPVTGTSCTDTSAVDSIRIYGLPAPPVIMLSSANCDNYHLQLTASEPVSGTYNWSDGTPGPVDHIDNGGPYRAWFTDLHGCISHRDTVIPMPPDYYFSYFPSGCYDLCTSQLPLALYGPPCVSFDSSAWINGATIVAGGPGGLFPYTVTGSGAYLWGINNGICTKFSDTMNLSVENCHTCQGIGLTAVPVCDTTNPASYSILISFNSPGSGTTFVLGTDIGPISPFSGTLLGPSFSSTLTFTTLSTSPLPDSITVELVLTETDGTKCVEKIRVALPSCHWVAERGITAANNDSIQAPANMLIKSALLVFPNPSSGEITISYDYGNEGTNNRLLSIYDAMGRKVENTQPQDVRGTWQLNTSGWTPGMYIIRMEGDGKALQVQRVIVMH